MKMEEVFRKLKPLIGKRADQLWVEWLIGDQVVKQMIELDLRLTLAGLFGAGFDQKQILLEPPPRERALRPLVLEVLAVLGDTRCGL